jgi:hypothetical protein
LRAFAHHESCAGALLVIQRIEMSRNIGRLFGSLVRERRQDNAIFQRLPSEFDRRERSAA